MAEEATAPASGAAAVSTSDTVSFTVVPRAIYCGVGGDIVALINGSAITFKNVPSGAILPIRPTRINSTNTTATNMVALY